MIYSVLGKENGNEHKEETSSIEYKDPCVFKQDDKYIYCELRKTDDVYEDIKNRIAIEITEPNLRINGGKLHSYLGLEYPELLVYLKDKETKEIVGYVGLTENFGVGLYISQIAVNNQYKHMGIGSILVKEAIRRAYEKGIDTVSADISYDNELSLALFSKHGFAGRGRYFVDVYEYMKNNFSDISNELTEQSNGRSF